ncbi:MAG: DUF1552 domain-containing protein [Acidobacteria bacterium]|nr:DUF1552 domain-containing protein [Acidobacteriota bacterium]
MTPRKLNRRAVLRGVGTIIGLPFLDAMVPAFGSPAREGSKQPLRLAVAYVPNGIIMDQWTPGEAPGATPGEANAEAIGERGSAFRMPRIMEPLAPFHNDLVVFSGLTHNNGRALKDGPGDHARAAASFLTGVHPRKTAGADIQNGVSFDQVAAQALGKQTRFASLELGCEQAGIVGNCDSGYSCAYSNSLAWRSETTPLPPEVNPRLVFERLFGTGDEPRDPAQREKQRLYNRSVLDLVGQDAARLASRLGTSDKRKLDEYLTGIREIETRLDAAEKRARDDKPDFVPSVDKPSGIPVEFQEHARLMFDMQVLAFQAGLTRVATLMLGREGSNRTYPEIGVPDAHHGMTHHKGEPEKIEKITKINRYHVEQLAYFLDRLKSTRDGDGTLLEHTMVLYGSGLADGNRHTHHDLPVAVAGGGAWKKGRHLRYPVETPLTNLFLVMLDRMGVRPETLGDSTGRLEHLTDL